MAIGDRVEQAIEQHTDVAREIERGEAVQPSRPRIVRSAVWLSITGLSLYLVAPALLDSLSSWSDIGKLTPGWLAVMAALQTGALVCLWELQRIALHTRGWYAIATSQLAGNGLAKVAPAGGAVGAALQYKMLIQAGVERAGVVSGLTASNLLTFGVVLVLPVLAIPAIVRGAVDRSLVEATVAGMVVFIALFAIGAALLAIDGLLSWVGRLVQRIRNRLRPRAEPLRGFPARLLGERDRILQTIGPRWKAALASTIGRWAFDYLSLLAALAAVGARPRPAVVLLAFCAAQLLAQIPLTPGGLGFVEAGLTATLTLAGVSAGEAALASFAYRLFTYWLPMPIALVAAILHRRRYVTATAGT